MSFSRLRDVRVTSVLLCLCVLAASPARADRIELVSRALPELVSETAGAGSSLFVGQQVRPMVSADGRWTVFVSSAPNLIAGQVDFNNGDDVFLYDRQNDAVTLVSRADGSPATAGNRTSGTPSISSDGRWIAFFSNAGDLVAGQVESNAGQDVFVYDRDSGAMILASHTAASNATTGNNFSLDPVISANGNAVVFVSSASNLMAGQVDTGGNDDIFYWDRATNTTTLVTHIPTSAATAVTGALSSVPVISADGAFVAYTTGATTLMSGGSDTNGRLDVYLWSRAANTNIIVSRGSTSAAVTGNGTASSARISADGAFILFRSSGTNHFLGQVDGNSGDDVFLFNRSLASVTLVSRNSSSASTTGNGSSGDGVISADGNWVAFPTRSSNLVLGVIDSNSADDVYLWSRATETTSLVTRSILQPTFAASAPSSSFIGGLGISTDGSSVAYLSRATNLVTGQTDTNGAMDSYVFDRATGTNQLGSGTAGSASATGNNAATGLSLSPDGQWLAFASSATDLLAGRVDTNAGDDVHLFGKAAAAHALVSRRDAGLPSNTLGADSTVGAITPVPNPVVSADGRYTVYQSTASQMIPGQVDVNGAADIFLYDRTAGTTTLVSRATGTALTAGNGESRLPVISANGRWVAFVSRATNLVASQNDGNSLDDVFLWDRATGSMALVSHSASGLVFAGSGSTPVLNADGSYVLFLSESNSIVPGQSGSSSFAKVYSYETATGTTQLVSHSRFSVTSGEPTSGIPWISANGRFVAFASTGLNFVLNQSDTTNSADVFQWDRTTDTFTLVSRRAVSATTASGGYSGHFSMSADGNWIAHSSSVNTLVAGVTDTNSQTDLYLWERAANTNRLISRSATSATTTANGATSGAVLSSVGNFVVFLSRATNLVSGGTDTNNGFDVFVYDRDSNTMQLASHATTSTQTAGNGVSRAVAVNSDGGRISFQSAASNLVASDAFGSSDIFLFDPSTGQVSLASYRDGTSTGLIDSSDGGAMSADGKVVAFSTLDRNVVPNDYNARQDVFLWIAESGTDLAIAKTNGVSSLVPGQTVTYLVTATNAGPLGVTGAVVTDTVPAAVQGVTWTCAAGGGAACGGASGSGSLSRVVNLPVNGTVTFTVTGTVSPDATGTLANTASIAPGGGVTDSNPANNSATDTDTLTPQADLLIAVSDSPDPVGRGATLTYTITMANAGPSTAASVTVTDTLPAGVTFVSASGTGWSCGHAGGIVTCTRPSQAPSPSVPAITVVVTAPVAAGIPTLTNTVAISAATNDPVANNSASAQTAVTQPSILVGPEQVRTTTEAGGTATFSVVLGSAPLAPVTITFTSSDTAEGTISPASVTFTPSDWSVVQTVTVAGVDDPYDDGDVAFTIVSAAASSTDVGYAGIDPADVPLTNQDDDTAGFGLTAHPLGMITTEAGGTTPFTISLTSKPRADVTVSFTSLDTAEGTVSPGSVTFTPDDWNQTRTVTITGVDDFYDDGDVAYTVTLNAAVSTDAGYAGIDPPDAAVTNQDDDAAGFSVTPGAGLATTEAGGTDTFTVVLTARPRSAVAVSVESSDTDEGTADAETLTFTTDDWNTPKTVTVTGVDDAYDDGDKVYEVTLGAAASSDLTWNGIDPSDVAASNEDDDTAGIAVAPFEGLLTTEGGGTATFTVTLQARPAQDVTIALASSDGTEGLAAPASLTFTTDDWDTPQTVTVTGQDDDYVDGDIAYTVVLEAAESGDAAFDGIDPADVAATNRDDGYEGVLYTITPCRVLDSRKPGFGPPLKTNQVAVVEVRGTCGIPATARAVAMTLTFSGATQPGTVLVFPGDLTQPPVDEFLRIRATHPRSMSAIMPLGVDGTLGIMPMLRAPKLNPTVHVILDVSGYFE